MRVLQFKKYNIFWSFSMLEYDTENLNSEEIYSSLRGVTEAIEKFSFRSQEDLNEPIKRDGKKDCDIVSIPGLTENCISVKWELWGLTTWTLSFIIICVL